MTDNPLRTRIARLLWEQCPLDPAYLEDCYESADILIRELKLKPRGKELNVAALQYVTGWIGGIPQ